MLAPTQFGVPDSSAREEAVCGERVAVGPGSLLVVGKSALPVVSSERRGSLLLIDGNTGQKIRTVNTPSEPVDVLVVSRPQAEMPTS